MDVSLFTVTGIEMVVHITQNNSIGFTPIEGIPIRRFGPRRYHGLIFKISGSNRYVVEERQSFDLQAGGVLYLPQGRPYIVRSGQPGDCYCVNFYIEGNALLEPYLLTPRNRAKWLEMFQNMTRRWIYREPGYRARCQAILYEMLASIEEDKQARYLPAKHVQTIRDAVARLEANPSAGETSIQHLSAECSMSETYFRRLFRELYGMSPKAYIMEARFLRAKSLLETSDLPVADVAHASGFENLYHFSRAFRTHEGVSPTEYRNQRR